MYSLFGSASYHSILHPCLIDNGVPVQRAPKPTPAKPCPGGLASFSPLFPSINSSFPLRRGLFVLFLLPRINLTDRVSFCQLMNVSLPLLPGRPPPRLPFLATLLLHAANALPSSSLPCPSKPLVTPFPVERCGPTSGLDGVCLRRGLSDIASDRPSFARSLKPSSATEASFPHLTPLDRGG